MERLKRGRPIDWAKVDPVTDDERKAFERENTRSLEELKAWATGVKRDPTLLEAWDGPMPFDEFYDRLMAGEFDEDARDSIGAAMRVVKNSWKRR